MIRFRAQCPDCRHGFHAKAPCTEYDSHRRQPCECEGTWYDETKQISGFCYILAGTPLAAERAAHAACPGGDYPYPCECRCHDR